MLKNGKNINPLYSVNGTIGADEFKAHIVLDKKNNSIHIHFFSNYFGNSKKPILVKQANTKFPEIVNIDLVKEIINAEIDSEEINFANISEEKELTTEQNIPSLRAIIRFEK